jgi:hypothetical protein
LFQYVVDELLPFFYANKVVGLVLIDDGKEVLIDKLNEN